MCRVVVLCSPAATAHERTLRGRAPRSWPTHTGILTIVRCRLQWFVHRRLGLDFNFMLFLQLYS